MKAMILAAGLGTRLRPLTDTISKPMIPVVNRPIMEHIVELLSHQGFENLLVNLHYKPEIIKSYFGNGCQWGVDLCYSYEPTLMGTAGGVKRVEKLLKRDTFLVFSSDILTDIDVAPLISFHKKRRALATIALKRVDDPSPYGAVLTDNTGRITAFQEKPARGEAVSDLINCGIYVFEPDVLGHIRPNEFFDFGRDLFSLLLKKGERLYGYQHDDYWLDVGQPSHYRTANFDALTGKVDVRVPGVEVETGIWLGKEIEMDSTTRIVGPACVGDHCVIRDRVRIVGPVVVGHRNFIDEGAFLHGCIQLPDCRVGKNVKISGEDTLIESSREEQEKLNGVALVDPGVSRTVVR